MQHSVLVDHELAVSQNGYIVRALVRLTGRAPTNANRVPINISIVLDRSGSMSGGPLEAARDAASFLVERLAPEDTVSVVAFDHEVTTIAPPATGAGQTGVTRAIREIESGGSTNLSGGWLRGRELVAEGKRAGAVNRVLILTDGHANAGITDPALLLGLATGAKREDITTSTIGFGPGYDERLLRGIADAGGGNTWYIERHDQASGIFEEEIEGLLSLAAQNLAVEINPSARVRLVAVHNDYPYSDLPNNVRRFELGDLYAREPKTMLVEFFVPGIDTVDLTPIAEITVHAHVMTDGGGIERQEVKFTVSTPLEQAGHTEPEIRREMLVQAAAHAREEAVLRERRGDHHGAVETLRQAAMMIRSAPAEHALGLEEQASDLLESSTVLERHQWNDSDRKYAAQRAYNTRRGKHAYEEKLRRTGPPRE